MKKINSINRPFAALVLSTVILIFNAQKADAQNSVEFRESNPKIDRWFQAAEKDVPKELPPIAKNITTAEGSTDLNRYYLIVYYDQAINDEVYKTVVKSKELPYEYRSQSLLAKGIAKKKGLYEIEYMEHYERSVNGKIFSYKVSVNGTIVYDGPGDNNKMIPSDVNFMFDHYENTFPGKFGYSFTFDPSKVIRATEAKKAIKAGDNEIKVAVSYNGKPLGESSLTYTVKEFKLTEGGFCGNPKYLREPDKATLDLCKKKFTNRYIDDMEEKNFKLVTIYLVDDSWREWQDSRTGYPINRTKDFTVYVSDAEGNIYAGSMQLNQDYIGNGNYSDVNTISNYKSVSDFFLTKKECFDLIKAKYGIK